MEPYDPPPKIDTRWTPAEVEAQVRAGERRVFSGKPGPLRCNKCGFYLWPEDLVCPECARESRTPAEQRIYPEDKVWNILQVPGKPAPRHCNKCGFCIWPEDTFCPECARQDRVAEADRWFKESLERERAGEPVGEYPINTRRLALNLATEMARQRAGVGGAWLAMSILLAEATDGGRNIERPLEKDRIQFLESLRIVDPLPDK